MALKGSFTGTTNNTRIQPKITWSAEQSVSGNYSEVTATLTYSRTNTGYTTSGAWSGSIVIDGKTTTGSVANLVITYNSNTVAMSATTKVYHNSDGTKKFTISCTGSIPVASLDTTTCTSTITLDTIARASQPSCITYPDTTDDVGNMGDTITIHMNKKAAFTHTVRYNWYNKKANIKTSVTDNCSWTIPLDFANDIPNVPYSWGTIYVDTYNGSTLIGTKSVKFTVHVPYNDNTKPTVTMSAELNNGNLPSAFNGLYIQGKSRLNVTLSAVGKYNASIKSYSALIDGKTYNSDSFTSNVIDTSGNVDINGYAKDSRGFTGSASEQISVIPYSKPLVIPLSGENAIMCYRSDGNGTRVGSSTSVWIKAKISFSAVVSDGTQKNFCSLQWRRKLSTEIWSDTAHTWGNLITSASEASDYNALLPDTVFDVKKSYTVQIMAIDTIGETDIKTFDIPTQDVALHLGKGGKNVSIGAYCDYSEDYTFYSDWKGIFDKGLTVSGSPLADFIVEQGTSGIWTYRKWNSGNYDAWFMDNELASSNYSASGNVYVSDTQYSFTAPFDNITSCVGTASSQATWSWGAIWFGDTGWIKLKIMAVAGTTAMGRCSLHITGKWK